MGGLLPVAIKGVVMENKTTITLVRSRIKNRPYCKTDGKYLGPTWNNDIGLQTIPNTPEEMFNLCSILLTASNTCVVTGAAVRPEILNTDRTLKNFKEEPISYIVLDLDKYEVPNLKKLEYNQVVKEVDKFIREYLPPEFQRVTYTLCFSSSFLIKEKPYLRCHIIFMLEEPQYPREIGVWIKKNGVPADATFYFNLTQPIFTAQPLWVDLVDPLTLKDPKFPRLSYIKKNKTHVAPGWQPYFVPEKNLTSSEMPTARMLPGKVGSFCRRVSPEKILSSMGYTHVDSNRYLAPESNTGIPGALVFGNGYVYSHHDGDPINQIIGEVFKHKRKSLNAYDISYNWAMLNKERDSSILKEFEFMLNQAILGDSVYQDEVQQELVYRTEWLSEGEYKGDNRKIIDSIILDMYDLHLTELSRDYLFNAIKMQTKHITLASIKNAWKNLKREQATQQDTYDPEANLRHMANIFKRQKIIYSHHKTVTGNFWCYFSDRRIWKCCNISQTKAFIYNHIHAAIPLKVEISYSKSEQLANIITREACLSMADFPKGQGWAFNEGSYGIIMSDIFSDSPQWQSKDSVRTLRKEDYIYKELPVTYKEWTNAETPDKYIDFLIGSCEEDLETVELIREYGGYILADSYYIHKMLIIEGVPGSGKSILAKVLQACVGSQYHSAVSISGLANRFGLGTLPGKKLAVMSEARGVDFNTLKALVPILLKIVGQDYVDTEAKGVDIVTELLECKIMMMTNKTPVLPDDTGALAQRLMMIKFNKGFRGTPEEVLGLDRQIIQTGLAGIIKWHLTGLERLSERGVFIEPERGRKAKEALIEQIDPLKNYITKYFTIDFNSTQTEWMRQREFILYFRAYCLRIGQPTTEKSIQKRASIRSVRTLFPNVYVKRIRREDKTVAALAGMIPKIQLGLEFADEIYDLQ